MGEWTPPFGIECLTRVSPVSFLIQATTLISSPELSPLMQLYQELYIDTPQNKQAVQNLHLIILMGSLAPLQRFM